MNRSPHTVRRYLNQPDAIAEVRDEKQELAVLYREKARACVTAIDDEKIKKSSALQLATAAGICTDKALLLAGEPTVNVAVLVEVAELIRERRDRGELARQAAEAMRTRRDAESERQHQPAKALLSLPASQP